MNNTQKTVLKMTDEVTNNLEEIISYAQVIALDNEVQYALENIDATQKDTYDYYYLIQDAKNDLKQYINLRASHLYDIVLVDRNGNVLEMDNNYQGFFSSEHFSAMNETRESFFVPYYPYTYNINTGMWHTFSYSCSVYSKQTYQYIGRIVLVMRYENVVEKLLTFDEGMGVDISIYDGDKMMYTSNREKDLRREMGEAEKSDDFLIYGGNYYFEDSLNFKDWKMVYSVSGESIQKSMNQVFSIIIFALIFTLLLILVVVFRLVKGMLRPLDKVVASMRLVSRGERNVRAEVSSNDEIEEVANVFNHMVVDIETNTKKLIESQKRENEAQIRMLIYQINPHFIYNTLNCVICLARKGDDEKIVVLTRTFIELLRSTLKSGVESYVSIADEKEYIDRYMDVLRYSYNNIPEIQWQIGEGLEKEHILKQILYPLVENSVFHGLLPVEDFGELRITVEKVDGFVEITVYDNGRGMTEEELGALRKSLKRVSEEVIYGEHIGLHNVNNRLHLIYGEESTVHVESEFGKGTLISFRYLPKI